MLHIIFTGDVCRGTALYPDSDCKGWVEGGQCELNPGTMAIYCVPECCSMRTSTTTMEPTTTTTMRSTLATPVPVSGRTICSGINN